MSELGRKLRFINDYSSQSYASIVPNSPSKIAVKANPTIINSEAASLNQRLQNILNQIDKQLQSKESKGLYESISRLTDLKAKINFLRKNNKEFDPKFVIICHYNLGYVYQLLALQKLEENSIDQNISCLNMAIQQAKQVLNDSFSKDVLTDFKLKMFYVRMLLQMCALLSQKQKHEMALQYGKQALTEVINIFWEAKKGCLEELQQIKKKKMNSVNGREQLTFSQALFTICTQQLNNLVGLQNYDKIQKGGNKQIFQKIKENSYYWTDNFENNCKIFRKVVNKINESENSAIKSPRSSILRSNSEQINTGIRNPLGLKVGSSWMNELSVGKVMRMSPITYRKLTEQTNLSFEFSERNLIQKVILTSLVYFCIGTQMRFLEDQQNNRYKNMSKEMRKSQMFYITSILVICKYIKYDCPLVDFLINSYLKHYHSILSPIEEKSSFFENSEIILETKTKEISTEGQYGVKTMEEVFKENQFGFFQRKGIFVHQSPPTTTFRKQMNMIDSKELQRVLAKSMDWQKKYLNEPQKSVRSKKQYSVSSCKKEVKISSISTKLKEPCPVKEGKNPESSKKLKLKRNCSTNKSTRKLLTRR